MLPARSKRYAGIDGEIPRLGLASHWQLCMIGLLVLVLLVMIFPRKALVEKLYAQETLDELTLSYIQNLYRANPRNTDVAILLARTQQDTLDLASLEGMLLQPASQGDPRQRTEASMILVKAYARALETPLPAAQKDLLKIRLIALMRAATSQTLPVPLARAFANLAFTLELPALGTEFLAKANVGNAPDALERYAREALGRGYYAVAAEYYLMARDQTMDVTLARRLYIAGIDTLMAGSLYGLAMQSARQHLGGLSQDRMTLRYLARTALAAGDPVQAALYARALVFQPGTPAP